MVLVARSAWVLAATVVAYNLALAEAYSPLLPVVYMLVPAALAVSVAYMSEPVTAVLQPVSSSQRPMSHILDRKRHYPSLPHCNWGNTSSAAPVTDRTPYRRYHPAHRACCNWESACACVMIQAAVVNTSP